MSCLHELILHSYRCYCFVVGQLDLNELIQAGYRCLAAGDLSGAEENFNRVLAQAGERPPAGTFFALAGVYGRTGRVRESVAALRREISLKSSFAGTAQFSLTRALRRLKLPAGLGDFVTNPSSLGQPAPKIVIACFPKSGSTFLAQLLSTVTGFPQAYMFFEAHQNEQELYMEKLLGTFGTSAVVQQHFRATEPNMQLCRAFGIRPVVLVRNIFDALVSMRDMIASEALREGVFFGQPFSAMTAAEKLDTVVRKYGFWYVEFFASWAYAKRDGRLDHLLVRYEDLMPNKEHWVREILKFGKFDPANYDITGAVTAKENNRQGARFNQGVSGRGAEELTGAQKRWLRGCTDAFSDVDFSFIGL